MRAVFYVRSFRILHSSGLSCHRVELNNMPATVPAAHLAQPQTPSPTPERRRRLEVKEAQASAWSRAVVAEEVRARAAGRLAAAEQERERYPTTLDLTWP